MLQSDVTHGLPAESNLEERAQHFGRNWMPVPDPKTWLELFIDSFEDTTLIILIVSAIVSLAVGFLCRGKISGTYPCVTCPAARLKGRVLPGVNGDIQREPGKAKKIFRNCVVCTAMYCRQADRQQAFRSPSPIPYPHGFRQIRWASTATPRKDGSKGWQFFAQCW